jgi:hypothetical protein
LEGGEVVGVVADPVAERSVAVGGELPVSGRHRFAGGVGGGAGVVDLEEVVPGGGGGELGVEAVLGVMETGEGAVGEMQGGGVVAAFASGDLVEARRDVEDQRP